MISLSCYSTWHNSWIDKPSYNRFNSILRFKWLKYFWFRGWEWIKETVHIFRDFNILWRVFEIFVRLWVAIYNRFYRIINRNVHFWSGQDDKILLIFLSKKVFESEKSNYLIYDEQIVCLWQFLLPIRLLQPWFVETNSFEEHVIDLNIQIDPFLSENNLGKIRMYIIFISNKVLSY